VSDVFREVDEEVRHEQMLKQWRKYGNYVIGAALGVVLGVAGSVGWKEYSLNKRLSDGNAFSVAMTHLIEDRPGAAAVSFAQLAEDAGSGYAALARLREAQALNAAGDSAGAVAALDRLAGDSGADQALRDLAAFLAVLYQMDSAAPGELDARLAPLMTDASPWRASARELAGLLAFRRGDMAAARDIFTRLVDDATAPQQVRGRAAEFLAILGDRPGGAG
jgi:hypothetical protein